MKIKFILSILLVLLSVLTLVAYPVNISGKVNISQIKEISVYRFDFENQENVVLKNCNIEDDGTFILNFEIEKPQLVSIFNNYIFITPNDKVQIEFNSFSSYSVKGKNAGNYKFFSSIKNIDLPNFNNGIYINDLPKYKLDLANHYHNISELFLNFKKENSVSKKFIEFVQKELRVKFLLNLLTPHTMSNLKMEDFPKNYFEEIKPKDLELDFFISNNYQKFLYYYSSYLSNQEFAARKKYLTCINMAASLFQGREKDFIQYLYFNNISKKQSLEDKKLVDSLYSALNISIKNDYYLSRIDKSYHYYQLNNKPFPPHILAIEFSNFDNKSITFEALLNQHKGKTLLIDFWATWCVGCIYEFPYSKNLEKSFDKLNVISLNFSIDDDLETWHKGVLKHDLNPEYQYFLEKKSSELLFEYLRIKAIPHYIIIDKKANISVMDAPRPQSGKILINTLSEISNKSEN